MGDDTADHKDRFDPLIQIAETVWIRLSRAIELHLVTAAEDSPDSSPTAR